MDKEVEGEDSGGGGERKMGKRRKGQLEGRVNKTCNSRKVWT